MSIQIIGNQPGLAIDVPESSSLYKIRGKGADWGFGEFSPNPQALLSSLLRLKLSCGLSSKFCHNGITMGKGGRSWEFVCW